MNQQLSVNESKKIPGLFIIGLAVYGDERGWFKENYQKEKLEKLGLPKLNILQNNVSFNKEIGVTRGIHAEPWDKYISIATGKAFAAIVDLRAGSCFGAVDTFELRPDNAILVPKGCGNSFQTLEPNTAYTYLVTDYWRPDAVYKSVHLADAELNIQWPIPLDQAVLSHKDQSNPRLKDVPPYKAEDL